MLLSQFFLPTLRDDPRGADTPSHRLMLRAGMIRQEAVGIYTWLPLGLRVLRQIEQIVREEMDRSNSIELLMPTLQLADLWRESERYDAYGPEMLRIQDRNKRDLLYSPTCEELITSIAKSNLRSYRDMPKTFYQIQWKFRDERRPRFGVMRGREFLMKDAYSFDRTRDEAMCSYHKMFAAYLRIFARIGLNAIPMQAETGPIGGDLSHEFIVLADTGESEVYLDSEILQLETPSHDADPATVFANWTQFYAATADTHDMGRFTSIAANRQISARGIEVGQVFYFGEKYTAKMGANFVTADGKNSHAYCGSYGIGVSRLVGAIVEAFHDKDGIIWPKTVAPFLVGLTNLRTGEQVADIACADIYKKIKQCGASVLLDDTTDRTGAKLARFDLIGLPYQIVIGRDIDTGRVEIKDRRTGQRQVLNIDEAIAKLVD